MAAPASEPVDVIPVKGHKGIIRGLEFSGDGKILASCAHDKKRLVKLWNSDSGNLISSLDGPKDWIFGVAFSPTENIVACVSADADRAVVTWDVRTKKQVDAIKELDKDGIVTCIAFSADGKTMAFGGDQIEGTIHFWNLKTSKLIATRAGHTHGVEAIACSHDSELYAAGCECNFIRIWEAKTGKERMTFGKGSTSTQNLELLLALAFMPGDKELLSIGVDKTLKRWNLMTGKVVETPLDTPSEVRVAAISTDCKLIATGDEKGNIRLWNVSGKLLATYKEHGDRISALAFNPAGSVLASGSADGQIKLRRTASLTR